MRSPSGNGGRMMLIAERIAAARSAWRIIGDALSGYSTGGVKPP